ncbi:MAG TPA: hypothetical protein VML54_07595 [Candidatus Limnocylindrales bacterium]|nr:hypothetical protein [Candidatus Limnocylindrales bacterium]
MTAAGRREQLVGWALLALALLASLQVVRDQWARVDRPYPGFAVMENLLVAVGGLPRAGLEPFDLVRAINGQIVTSGRQIQAEVERHPPGTTFHYLVSRRGQIVEADIPSGVIRREHFSRYLLEGFLPAFLYLSLAAVVVGLPPLPTPVYRHVGHRIVLEVLRVDLAAGGGHGRRQDGVVDVEAVSGVPPPVHFGRVVHDRLGHRLGLEA